jgi:ABC-type Fe3+ transport system permease subunit
VILLYGHGTELLSIAVFLYWQRGEPGTVCALSLVLMVIILLALGAARLLGSTRVDQGR